MVEAWTLLRQHSNRLNIEELLKHTYEVCQEMGLMEDLLKLPFTDTEQVMICQCNLHLEIQDKLLAYKSILFFLGVFGEIFTVQRKCSES